MTILSPSGLTPLEEEAYVLMLRCFGSAADEAHVFHVWLYREFHDEVLEEILDDWVPPSERAEQDHERAAGFADDGQGAPLSAHPVFPEPDHHGGPPRIAALGAEPVAIEVVPAHLAPVAVANLAGNALQPFDVGHGASSSVGLEAYPALCRAASRGLTAVESDSLALVRQCFGEHSAEAVGLLRWLIVDVHGGVWEDTPDDWVPASERTQQDHERLLVLATGDGRPMALRTDAALPEPSRHGGKAFVSRALGEAPMPQVDPRHLVSGAGQSFGHQLVQPDLVVHQEATHVDKPQS